MMMMMMKNVADVVLQTSPEGRQHPHQKEDIAMVTSVVALTLRQEET